MKPEMTPQNDQSQQGFEQAMSFAMEALYAQGAAKEIAKSLKLGNDPVESLANTAYEVTAVVDERTNGAVPDEMFALLASSVLEEVADIAQAAGIEVKGSTVAAAMKTMILRFVGEQGGDASQLQAAMDQVDVSEFDRLEGEV